MKPYQRQTILLIGFMSLLVGVFLFFLQYAPEVLTINPSVEINNSINASQNVSSDLPPIAQDSIEGIKLLLNDFTSIL